MNKIGGKWHPLELEIQIWYSASMTLIYTIILLVVSILSWIALNSQDALAILAEWKRQLRLRVIRRTGNLAVQELAQQLSKDVEAIGMDTQVADQIIKEHEQTIIHRLGTKYANQILGEPTPIERYH